MPNDPIDRHALNRDRTAADEFSKILRISGGDDVHVYLERLSGRSDDPEYRLANIVFVNPSMTASINGVPPDQLRGLARFLREYANRIDSEAE
jgi:hypothetical protein